MIKVRLSSAMGNWQARHNTPLSIPDLAEKTGLSVSFLYRFHSGTIQRLDLDKLETLCTFLGCTPNDLLWSEVYPEADPPFTVIHE